MRQAASIKIEKEKIYNMKKTYISPLTTEVCVASENMLAASLGIYNKSVDTSAESAQLSGGRRGEWGNLW